MRTIMVKFCKNEKSSLFHKIKKTYWNIIPYDWRPQRLLYRIHCFLWYRYTTIKPRTLNYHTWCDRSILIPHIMFEILSQFLEKECSPGHVEWYGEYGHKIEVDGKQVYVMDEIKSLYDWWHNDYGKEYQRKCDEIWEEVESCRPEYYFRKIESHPQSRGHEDYYEYDPKFNTQENKVKYKNLINEIHYIESYYEEQLQKNLHRLVNIIPYLWT